MNVSAPTEDRNPASVHIDTLPTLEVLRLLNAEDSTVRRPCLAVLPDLARLVDDAVTRIRAGGTVHYFGAGHLGPARRPRRRRSCADLQLAGRTLHRTSRGWCRGPRSPPSRTSRTTRRPADRRPRSSVRRRRDRPDRVGPHAVRARRSRRGPRARWRSPRWSPRTPSPRSARWPTIVIAPATGPEVVTGSTRLKAGYRAEARPQRLLDLGDDRPRAHLVEPHGRRRRDQRQAARTGRPDPAGGHRCRRGVGPARPWPRRAAS